MVQYFDVLSCDNFGIEEISTHAATLKSSYSNKKNTIILYLDMFAYDGLGIEEISANIANMCFVYMVQYVYVFLMTILALKKLVHMLQD